MSRVFLSHSRRDSRQATAVKQWLIEQESALVDEIYLDLDPHTGIRPGERWKEALNRASARCEAVICLLSKHWLNSRECQVEFRYAENLHKAILCARLEPVPDDNITSEWQRCDLFPNQRPTTEVDISDGDEPVVFDSAGLQRLLNGLRTLGIGAEHFPWPPPNDPDRAPYRGWAPLEEVDAAVFFGRDAQILRGLDVLHRMRSTGVESLFVVLGPSGAGKSSFLRAGLIPRLRRDDRRFLPLPIVRPERAVLTGQLGLAHAIHRLRTSLGLADPMLGEIKSACRPEHVEQLRGWLEEARQAARARQLDVAAGQPPPTMVLPVDQAEELFNADAGAEAPRFLELLAHLVEQEAGVTPALIVAVTIRADRYEPLQVAPQLAGLETALFDQLKPLPPAGYTEVITGPARRATAAGSRLTVEPALVDRLLTETAEGADALPLLALTLERLYHDFGADGDLTVAEYESMGGMGQVVQNEVDQLLPADPEKRQAQLDTLHDAFIPWLATINPENDQPMRRLARWDDLPAESQPLIQQLVEKRLLVKDSRDGNTVVQVALESLLRQWRDLAAWLRDEAQDLKDADALERAAADWRASGRNESWLLEGTRLTEAETLAAQTGFRDRLDPTRDYLNASRTRENQRIEAEKQRQEAELQAAKEHAAALRKRSRVLIGVLAVTAVIAAVAVIGFVQATQAKHQAQAIARQAIASRLRYEATDMLTQTRGGGDTRAFQELIAAQAVAADTDAGGLLDGVVQRLTTAKIIDTGAGVSSVVFSPDGRRLATCGADKTVRIWYVDTGQPVFAPMTGHTAVVGSVTFSPDGHRLASGSGDSTVRLWNADTGQPIGQPLTGHTGGVPSVTFSPDGHRLASGGGDGTVRLWNADTGQPLGPPLTGHTGAVRRVAFSPDGHRLASAGDDTTVRLWNADTGQPLEPPMTGHTNRVLGVVFSPDGHRLASAGQEGLQGGAIRLWNADTGQPVGPPLTGHTRPVFSVAFSPNGRVLASASYDTTVRLWNADTGQPLGPPMTGHTDMVVGVAFRADGHRLASAGWDHTVRLWDLDAHQQLVGHTAAVNSVAFSPEGHRLASAGDDNVARLWNVDTGDPLGAPLVHSGAVASVAFSPDGHQLASASYDGTLWLWNADTGKPLGPPMSGHTDSVLSVAFSPDGRRIASGSFDKTVRMWHADTGRPFLRGTLTGHTGAVNSVAFSPDGHRLATASSDTTVRLWNADTGQPIGAPLTGHTGEVMGVAFSPDGHRLASASADDTVRLWNADTGQPIGAPLTGHTDIVNKVAFGPDGHRLASASADDTVRLWNADTGQPIGAPLTGHTDAVRGVAFSPDGRHLASGSFDKTVRIWPAIGTPEMLCAKLTANMSRKQWREWVSPDIDYIKVCPDLPVAPD